MHRAVVSLPDGLHAQVRWVAGELCAAAGLAIGDGAPAIPLDPTWDLRAAAATLARTEELGGAADEHGRFPASASALAAGAAPLDEIVLALREAAEAVGVEPAPAYPEDARFAVALTHDIDTPWRWSRARAARRRFPAQERPRGRRLRCHARRGRRPGARAAPPPARERPQLVAQALRRERAAPWLPLDLLRARRAS